MSSPLPSEVTPAAAFATRRRLLAAAGLSVLNPRLSDAAGDLRLPAFTPAKGSPPDTPTPAAQMTRYGNFYEFGPDKDSPAKNAHRLRTQPWTVAIEGEVRRPRQIGIEDLLRLAPLEERIYRFRCVEGWSAVVPWIGFPLRELLRQVEPTGNARYVEFTSLADPEQMPYVRLPLLDWPYTEGLRLDEAMHPLTLIALGMYGEILPRQNGAPLRLVVPWKYGFKNTKSIVRIRLTEKPPQTSWMKAAPREYGFYANVNPAVDHPRWKQDTERRLGEFRRRPTLPFNGYAEQVASLYQGMDLRTHF